MKKMKKDRNRRREQGEGRADTCCLQHCLSLFSLFFPLFVLYRYPRRSCIIPFHLLLLAVSSSPSWYLFETIRETVGREGKEREPFGPRRRQSNCRRKRRIRLSFSRSVCSISKSRNASWAWESILPLRRRSGNVRTRDNKKRDYTLRLTIETLNSKWYKINNSTNYYNRTNERWKSMRSRKGNMKLHTAVISLVIKLKISFQASYQKHQIVQCHRTNLINLLLYLIYFIAHQFQMIFLSNSRRDTIPWDEPWKEHREKGAMAAAETCIQDSFDLLLARDNRREYDKAGIIVEITLARSMGS